MSILIAVIILHVNGGGPVGSPTVMTLEFSNPTHCSQAASALTALTDATTTIKATCNTP